MLVVTGHTGTAMTLYQAQWIQNEALGSTFRHEFMDNLIVRRLHVGIYWFYTIKGFMLLVTITLVISHVKYPVLKHGSRSASELKV